LQRHRKGVLVTPLLHDSLSSLDHPVRRVVVTRYCVRRCERQELNLHGFPHWILSPARLPIPPLSQTCYATTVCGKPLSLSSADFPPHLHKNRHLPLEMRWIGVVDILNAGDRECGGSKADCGGMLQKLTTIQAAHCTLAWSGVRATCCRWTAPGAFRCKRFVATVHGRAPHWRIHSKSISRAGRRSSLLRSTHATSPPAMIRRANSARRS
jgi:hypothetical protein